MSRPNKVNPGMYTQRGRLTQDDAARELHKQSAFGSPHTWQPVNTKTRPRLTPDGDAAGDTRSADHETMVETSPQVGTRPASRVSSMTATKAAPSTAKAKTAKAKTARTRKSKRTTKAKTGKAIATATNRTTTKPTRKAVLARKVGGGGAAPHPTTKRRKR